MENKAVEIVRDLGYKPLQQWKHKSFIGENIDFAAININGSLYCVSSTGKSYVYSKEGKKGIIIIYQGYSLGKLKEAIMREEKPINA